MPCQTSVDRFCRSVFQFRELGLWTTRRKLQWRLGSGNVVALYWV